ncbi:hypothetical protein G7054_g12150 [Neopestalotiopsis clavispora]|nr:hypothetical protein G7054_g12150 [Neopestalotiopsis clavispora]
MFKSIVTWALLASSAVYAAPVQEISARDLFKGLADFERLSTTSLGTSPIGYYGGLQFNGLAAVTAGTRRLLSGLAPRSGTNVAAFGNVTKGLSSPVITSEFAGSKTGNFTLSSLFFGCVDSSNKPVGCKLAVSGYDKRGVLVVYQPFYFTPSGGALNNLSPAYFNNFVGLSYVKFAATFVGGVLGSYFFDNVYLSANYDFPSYSSTYSADLAAIDLSTYYSAYTSDYSAFGNASYNSTYTADLSAFGHSSDNSTYTSDYSAFGHSSYYRTYNSDYSAFGHSSYYPTYPAFLRQDRWTLGTAPECYFWAHIEKKPVMRICEELEWLSDKG